MKRARMLRKHNARGTCTVACHGSWCVVACEIQEDRATKAKAKERREWKKEVQRELEDGG